MNEYHPWINLGITELDYFKHQYLSAQRDLKKAHDVIEKMKNCSNCKHNTLQEHPPEICRDCGRKSKHTEYPNWELED